MTRVFLHTYLSYLSLQIMKKKKKKTYRYTLYIKLKAKHGPKEKLLKRLSPNQNFTQKSGVL